LDFRYARRPAGPYGKDKYGAGVTNKFKMESIKKIANLLRTPEATLIDLFERMEQKTKKVGVAQKIYEQNNSLVKQKLEELGILAEKADAQYVEAEILAKTNKADESFYEFLGRPNFSSQTGCEQLVKAAKEAKPGAEQGFFIREEKLRSFLVLNPPKNILKALNYKSVDEMLQKESLFEVFAALRFVENERWLNEVFFRPYNDLTVDNFEEREIRVQVLGEKWLSIAEKFVGKKLHNISHLKEAGLVFIIPVKRDNFAGQSLETFSLILHYLYEIEFYSHLFQKYAIKSDFGNNLVKLLSGRVLSSPSAGRGIQWLIIQRYLAKNDPQDPRLFIPHINPETLHWLKAEKDIDDLAKKNPQIKLEFWNGVDDFVGEIFPAGKKGEEIVSFDLVDNIISLTHGGLGKYLYHQQEALWNKIFIEFMGEEKLEEALLENIDKGFVEL